RQILDMRRVQRIEQAHGDHHGCKTESSPGLETRQNNRVEQGHYRENRHDVSQEVIRGEVENCHTEDRAGGDEKRGDKPRISLMLRRGWRKVSCRLRDDGYQQGYSEAD